ncbi:phosphoribosyl transferase domain protein, partial [Chlamydia psittaci 84-8471/1]
CTFRKFIILCVFILLNNKSLVLLLI